MLTRVRRLAREKVPPRMLVSARHASRLLAPPRRVPLGEVIGEGQCGIATIRSLRWEDADAWGVSMAGNFDRMQEWWGLQPEDRARMTDKVAFAHHLREWESRRRRGEGVCLALIGPDGLVGELQVWHLAPGGLTCEAGLWMAPTDMAVTRSCGGCLGYAFDRLFEQLGIQRIDAPVAAKNTMPRAFLRLGGFEVDASIERWRELHGRLVDYDLYGLTQERWDRNRGRARRMLGEWGPRTAA